MIYRQAIITHPKKSCLVILPLESDAKDYYSIIRSFSKAMQISVSLQSSPSTIHLSQRERSIDIVTPISLLAWTEKARDRSYMSSVSLVLCEGLELLDDAYELAVSILLHATQTLPVRFVGVSASVNDCADLARWLRVDDDELYDFRPSDRDQPLSTTSQSFTIPPSPALFKAMIGPAHSVLRSISSSEAAVVFAPSRGQCRTVANDLITESAIEMDTRGFLPLDLSTDDLEFRLARFRDRSLIDGMMHGIGVLHQGLLASDRLLTLELFADGILRVLIVPREMCWTLPVRAALVVVLGTQYFEVQPHHNAKVPSSSHDTKEHRLLKEYTVHELVRMQGLAVRHNRAGRFHLLCQAEQRDTYMRFLEEGLPLESSILGTGMGSSNDQFIHQSQNNAGKDDSGVGASALSASSQYSGSEVLRVWVEGQRASGSIRGKQDTMDLLSHTFLWRRMQSNPTYYDVDVGIGEKARDATLSRFVDTLFAVTKPPTPDTAT